MMDIDDYYKKYKLDLIKNKYKKGIFVEVGAGCPVYHKISCYPNCASSLVYAVESPNDWIYNQREFGHNELRAVSPQVLENFINNKKQEIYNQNIHETELDYIFTNTIQIGNDEKTETHGWFGIYELKEDKTTYYHFTIPKTVDIIREEQVNIIGDIGINLLFSGISEYVDIVLDSDFMVKYEKTLKIISTKGDSEYDVNSSVVFTNDGNTLRLSDFLRKDFKKLVLFKGSFNPVHDQHLEMIKSAKIFAGSRSSYGVFCISILNRDDKKQVLDIKNLIKRIKLINSLGYSVIIDRYGYFEDNYKHIISNPSFDKDLYYVMGADTFERFLNDNIKNARIGKAIPKYNCTFYYSDRDNIEIKHGKEIKSKKMSIQSSTISSTSIRDALKYNDIEKLKGLVSDELYTKYKDIYEERKS